ncbi:MAG TPA: class I SAM-dependent methyltransferase, partial [Myxococcota bacterium]|nr:class I SAM-dependent methyltransferase [Myxococcota bacterium]
RFTCWRGVDESRFAGIQSTLRAVEAPMEVCRAQVEATADGVRQGIGVAVTEKGLQWRLYLHTHSPQALRSTYRSLRWDQSGAIREDDYSFHYLPALATGQTPDQLVHPDCAEVMAALLRTPRVQELSGFYVRKHQSALRQVDLTFAWHPRLQTLEGPLRTWCDHIGAPTGWLDELAHHPVRHVAFSGPEDPPAATLYFSAAIGHGEWPNDLHALREAVRQAAESARRATEEGTFAALPPALPPDPSIGAFYDTHDLSPWRTVLGPNLHYHFGLFDAEDPVESRAEGAFERAVRVLYPHIPPGCRVYDMGCGWGGPALQLVRDLGCRVEGITASHSQFRWCNEKGLLVRHADMEATLPPGRFDVVLMLESFCHVR